MRRLDIDFLRMIAIVLVVVCHTFDVAFAAVGVQIFFLLSGFLLANFSENFSSKMNFLVHRFFRLFPLAILMCLIFFFRFTNVKWFVLNILLLQTLFPSFESFPGGWSISYEWLFSLIIATGLFNNKYFFIIFKYLTFFCLLMIVAQEAKIIQLSLEGINFSTFTMFLANLIFFIAGIVIKNKKPKKIKNSFLFVIILISIFLGINFPDIVYLCWFFLVISLASIVINNAKLVKFLEKCRFASIVSNFGKFTYGIFCSHFIIMISLTNVTFKGLQLKEFLRVELGITGLVIHFLIVLFVAYTCGALSYHYLEKPSLRLARWLNTKTIKC